MSKKFDVIVGNPPYNLTTKTGVSIAGAGNKLWMNFVHKSTNHLNKDGYLAFVHPIGWRQMHNKMWNLVYSKYQIIDAVLEPIINWNVNIKVDYYILQNTTYKSPTSVVYKDGSIELIDFRNINGLTSSKNDVVIFNKMKSINTLLFLNKQTHHHTRKHMSVDKKGGFIYPIKHTGAQDYWWSNKEHDWQNKKKVIVSYTGHLSPFYDNGNLGTSQHSHIIFVNNEKEANYIIRLLNSNLYKFFIKIQKTSGFNDIKILNTLPYPTKLCSNFTDDELYDHFGLTKDEIDYIEETIK